MAAQDLPLLGELLTSYVVAGLPAPTEEIDQFLRSIEPSIPDPFVLQLVQLVLLVVEQPEAQPVSAAAALEREYLSVLRYPSKVRLYAAALFVARTVNYQRHVDLVERAAEFAEQLRTGDTPAGVGQLELALLMLEYGNFLVMTGSRSKAEDALQRGIAAARLSGEQWLSAWGVGWLSFLHAEIGRATSASRLAQESLGNLRRVLAEPGVWAEPALFALITVALDRGRTEEAETWLAEASPATNAPATGMAPERAMIEAQVRLGRGDGRGAVRTLQDFARANPTLTAEQRVRSASVLAQAHLQLGQFSDAERDVAVMEGASTSLLTQDRAALLRARLLLGQGKATTAHNLLAPLVRTRDGRPQDKNWLNVLMTYGISCTTTERNEEALEAFQAAGVLAESLGLNTPNARHTQLASALRPDELALTAAERNVLAHLSSGDKLNQIAEDLCISPNTLKTHLRRIYRKLGVADRHEAVVRARALGIRPRT